MKRLQLPTGWRTALATAGVLAALSAASSTLAAAPRPAPGHYVGLLPCADCPGIETRLDLDVDGSYSLRERYRGREGNGFDELGRWAMSSDGRTLVLRSGRDTPRYFTVSDGSTLEKLDLEAQPIVSAHDHRLRKDDALPALVPSLALAGLFRYQADAATLSECRSGRQLPVAAAEDYPALERAYLQLQRTPGEALMAQLRGRIETRQVGDGMRPALVVEHFNGFAAEAACPRQEVNADFVTTRWRLIRLSAGEVASSDTPHQPHLVFDARGRVIGATGCNRLVARYDRNDAGLQIASAISTRMACAQGMDVEAQMLAMLERVRGWRLAGAILDLQDENGQLLARFQAEQAD